MIRLAEKDDKESIVAILNQAIDAKFQTAFTEPLSPEEGDEWFPVHLSKSHPTYVYIKDEMVVGWLSIGRYRSGRAALRYTVEVSYYIHPGYQGKGIGNELLQYGIEACRQLNYKTLLAIILDKNIPSIRLMEKFGFEQWACLPGIADFDGVECSHVYYGLRIQ